MKLPEYRGHDLGKVFATSAIFSPDGTKYLTTDDRGMLIVWDFTTGKALMELDHEKPLEYGQFLPDEVHILSVNTEGTVYFWEWESQTIKYQLDVEDPERRYFQFTHDLKYLMVLGHEIIIYDLYRGVEKVRFKGHHKKQISWGEITPDGQYLVTSGADNHVRVWNIEHLREEIPFLEENGDFRKFDISRDGAFLAGIPYRGIRIYELSTRQLVHEERFREDVPVAIKFSPQGTYFIVGFHSKPSKVYETRTGREVLEIEDLYGTNFDFSKDGKMLLEACGNGIIIMYNFRKRTFEDYMEKSST